MLYLSQRLPVDWTMTVARSSPAQLADILERFLKRAARDPEQVALLQELALTILEAFPPDEKPVERVEPQAVSVPDLDAFVESYAARPLSTSPAPAESLPNRELDLPRSERPARLYLKARTTHWLLEHGFTTEPAALAERRSLIEEGKERQCNLWMLDLGNVNPNDTEGLRRLALAYERAARITSLRQKVGDTPETLKLAAKFQLALRLAVSHLRPSTGSRFPFTDLDQKALFLELRELSQARELYLYGLALKDTLSTQELDEAQNQLFLLEAQQVQAGVAEKSRKQLFNKLTYHLKKLQNRPDKPEAEWAKVAESVAALTATGLPESDLSLRRALEPAAPLLPEDTPHDSLERILGATARVAREHAQRSEERARKIKDEQPPEVQRVADLVRGKTLVVIGGQANAASIRQIEDAFNCTVHWVTSRPHDSPSTFRAAIRRENVLLVLLLIRWSSHVFGEVQTFCQQEGKYLVRVPTGYNVKKLAQVILGQVSQRLTTPRKP